MGKYGKHQLLNDLEKSIKSGNEIVVISHSILDNIDDTIQYIIKKSLRIESNDIISPVFSCLKEVITNALKANLKQLLIERKNYSMKKDSEKILTDLKKALVENELRNYTVDLKEKHMFISIHFIYNLKDYLKIKIVNPVPLDDSQLERINLKIKKAKDYESLAHFYMENPDPMAEGMGLGLSMVIVIMKGLGISPENLKIETDREKKTTAVIQIPYSIISAC